MVSLNLLVYIAGELVLVLFLLSYIFLLLQKISLFNRGQPPRSQTVQKHIWTSAKDKPDWTKLHYNISKKSLLLYEPGQSVQNKTNLNISKKSLFQLKCAPGLVWFPNPIASVSSQMGNLSSQGRQYKVKPFQVGIIGKVSKRARRVSIGESSCPLNTLAALLVFFYLARFGVNNHVLKWKECPHIKACIIWLKQWHQSRQLWGNIFLDLHWTSWKQETVFSSSYSLVMGKVGSVD